jgi:RNA polymerase sigma-70 factor (ECF subfamily)
LVSAERLAALEAAITELPHKLKTALILFALENRSQAECAELLGVSAKTVETRVYRARKILEKKIARK